MKTQNKFRVWNGREMVYDVMVGKFGVFYVNPMAKGDGLNDKDSASLSPFNTKYPDEVPVMECIGEDCMGNDIYVDDIMTGMFGTGAGGKSTKCKEMQFRIVIIQDKYNGRKFSFSPISSLGNYRFYPILNTCKVVGNIYQNPIK